MKKIITAATALLLACSAGNAQSLVEMTVRQNPLFEVSTNYVNTALTDEMGSVTIGGDIVVKGGSGTYSYIWYSPSGASLGTDRTLTVTERGLYRLEISDTCDCTQSITFDVNETGGVDAVSLPVLNVSPNPTSGYIEFNGCDAIQLTAVSMAGQLVALIDGEGAPFRSADLGNLSAGTYLLVVTDTAGKVYTAKIIKK